MAATDSPGGPPMAGDHPQRDRPHAQTGYGKHACAAVLAVSACCLHLYTVLYCTMSSCVISDAGSALHSYYSSMHVYMCK